MIDTPERGDFEGGTGDLRNPQINYYIGLTYEALGKKAEAKSYLQQIKGSDPAVI